MKVNIGILKMPYSLLNKKLHYDFVLNTFLENEGGDKKSVLKLLKITLGLDPNSKLLTDIKENDSSPENGYNESEEELSE